MPLPAQSPQLPKWPFLLGDAALLAAGWTIEAEAAHPLRIGPIVAIVACVLGAAIAGGIPFLADYGRRQEEAIDNRQRALEALARTVAAAAEQISIAASGLNEIADLAQRTLRQAEQLPARTLEQIAQFDAKISSARAEEKKAQEKDLSTQRAADLKRLEAAGEKIARAAAEWSAAAKTAADAALAPKTSRASTPESSPEPAAASSVVEAPASADTTQPAVPEPAAIAGPGPEVAADSTAEPAAETPDAAPDAVPAPAEKPAPRKRTPRKAAVKIPLTEDGDLSTELPARPREEAPAPPAAPGPELELSSEGSQSSPDEAAPVPAVSADGATRLLITAYIGIGNRLFIRGDGPGLSWDKGVPLQFVSIGKWRWDTAEATGPVRFKLYKNDEVECSSLGAQVLEPGHQQEVTAAF